MKCADYSREITEYLNKLNFVPQRIKFEVNNDLSKLLVGL